MSLLVLQHCVRDYIVFSSILLPLLLSQHLHIIMSFEEISHISDNRAETKVYTPEEATHIYALIHEIRAHGTPVSSATQQLRQLEYLMKKVLNQRLHATTLIQYHRSQCILRGLRITIKPMLFKFNRQFMSKWYAILNKCSLEVILLIIEVSQVIRELEAEIHELQVTSLDGDFWQMSLDEINRKLEEYTKEERKMCKFRQDTIDYKLDDVYAWAEVYTQERVKKKLNHLRPKKVRFLRRTL
ncbi:hypothetical protein NDU88_005576 [Pleurodeles waltl]|uniref:Uncharacterized protein n=1 Tax=Pleurodeles waltl TaxID=8319 RepID=A0AAV7UJX7_PLEWA|nr:hypothetical protein NDU88_005576 [Pleurodeles waltl]